MTVDDAIRLAHHDRDDFPLRQLKEPAPTAKEALAILRESVRRCWFNWLTGVEAIRLLEEFLGTEAAGNSAEKHP